MSDTRAAARPDIRIERSRAQLIDALESLLRTSDPREISVSALCAEAGVSRPTFYQHFATIDDVAVAGIERRFALLAAELEPGVCGPEASALLLERFLSELDADRAAWQRTIGSGTALSASRDAVEGWLVLRLAERVPEAGPAVLRYAAAGFLGAVRAWLLEPDADRPPAAALAADLVALSARVLGPAK